MSLPASVLLAVLLAVLSAACSPAADAPAAPPPGITTATPAPTPAPTRGVEATAPTPARTPESLPTLGALDEVPLADPSLARTDVSCSREFIASGGGDAFPEAFVSGHFVVDGILGEACMGEPDPRLLDAWYWLRIVAPAEDLADVALFTGFDATSEFLAYVEPLLAVDGTVGFQVTVNLRESVADEVELMLTMAHEFTHLFTQTTQEIDFNVPFEECETYFDGAGCFHADSYISRWTERFWGDWLHEIDQRDPDRPEGAWERCRADDSFISSYAARNPEEDFAETFAGYVYSIPATSPGLEARYEFFETDPDLRKYRERVAAFGLGPLPSPFDGCG